ncbi:hypothetical protein [Caulobacter sp. 17J80-11]|uniref:hypothetical protein n=1 Tax=Caulobacter sp. 17J80-11 TaxID=2763502 RepID=UPI0016537D78|nr:hypothetical protein [Caulobacter sp. 17J80-11]MBC6982089.1 hypothetical protein [Caulobacter sp. 17J80-11]
MPSAPHRQTFRRRLAAAGLSVALATALTASAQPVEDALPLTEPEARGAELARVLMQAIDFRGYLVRELSGPEFAAAHALDAQPGWEARLQAAATAEVDAQAPLLELKAGRLFAMKFTTRELDAVNAFLKQPGGQALLAYAAGAASGQAPPAPSGQARSEVDAFLATPEGASFRAKAEHLDDLADQLKEEVMDTLTAGVVRRFEESAQP